MNPKFWDKTFSGQEFVLIYDFQYQITKCSWKRGWRKVSGGDIFGQTPVLVGLGLGVDFTFAWDNNDYNGNNDNNKNTPHLNFLKGTLLGDEEQEVGIRDKGQGIKVKGQRSWVMSQRSKDKG